MNSDSIHPDDAAVDALCAAMKTKLREAREKKSRGGWETCHHIDLSQMLREHVEKGDPVDVANFCAFLFAKGSQISKLIEFRQWLAQAMELLEDYALESTLRDHGDDANKATPDKAREAFRYHVGMLAQSYARNPPVAWRGVHVEGDYLYYDEFPSDLTWEQRRQLNIKPLWDTANGEQPRLKVRLQSFPESNGKRNWTAILGREGKWGGLVGSCGGITIERGELWNRVAYEAERARFLLGERDTEPFILDYGDDIETPEEWAGEVIGPQREAARRTR